MERRSQATPRPWREKGPTTVAAREEAGPILNGIPSQLPDIDPDETAGMAGLPRRSHREGGRQRARYVMLKLLERAREMQVGVPSLTATDYINTISPRPSRGSPATRRSSAASAPTCAGTPRHGAPRAAPGHRRRRPHLDLRLGRDPLRGGLQPLLPRQGPPRRRRPGLLPGPRLPRHVRPRLPRGPPVRGPARRVPPGAQPRRGRQAARAAVLPAPAPACRTSGSSRPCRWASAR